MTKFKQLFEARKGTALEEVVPARRRGRPAGKRSDPEFEQVTAYIRKDTHYQVKLALMQEGKGKHFSEVVEEQLAKWLKSHTLS